MGVMNGMLAIIVEDDLMLSTIFTEAVKQAGYVTETYNDGSQALKRFGEIVPALIVMDMHLPGVMGPDLLRSVRGRAEMDDTIVIVATADPLLGEIYQEQADFVMIKPISFGQLRDLAQRLGQKVG